MADDLSLLSHSRQQMQEKTRLLADASSQIGLNIHKGKSPQGQHNQQDSATLHDTNSQLVSCLSTQVTQRLPDQMAHSQFIQSWSFYELHFLTNTVELQPGTKSGEFLVHIVKHVSGLRRWYPITGQTHSSRYSWTHTHFLLYKVWIYFIVHNRFNTLVM